MKLHVGAVKKISSGQQIVGAPQQSALASGYTVTRGHTPTTATVALPSTAGSFVEYVQNVAKYNRGGLLVEEARTNLITNPRGENPLATYWSSAGTVIGRGVEDGLDYVDLQFTSPSATGGFAMGFSVPLASSPTEINTLTFYARVVGGSMTNITALQMATLYRDGATAALLNATQLITPLANTAPSLASARFIQTTTAPAATVDKIPRFRLAASGAYDVTVRFAGVQFEVGPIPTSVILPVRGTPASTTRNADVITRSITPTDYPSRNMWIRSEEFDNAVWLKSNLTVTPDAAVGPYTGTLADALVSTATTSAHTISQALSGPTLFVGTRYTISVYAKAGTLNFFRINPSTTQTGGGSLGVYFDLTTGDISIAGTPTPSMVFSCTAIGSGWWRLFISYTAGSATAGTSNHVLQFTPTNASNTYLGDGTVGGYVWGAQFTVADSMPAYVQTGAAIAASHSRGTIVANAQFNDVIVPTPFFPAVLSIYDDTANNLNCFYNPFTNNLETTTTVRGVGILSTQFFFTIAPVVNQPFRIAISWDTSTGVVNVQAHNGTTLSAVATFRHDMLPVFNNLGIGLNGAVLLPQAAIQINRLAMYNTVVPTASLYQLIAA
jgi:hypothetical protein